MASGPPALPGCWKTTSPCTMPRRAAKLLEQGAVLLGKGNMDEFAMGSSTENSAFFATRNPWDQARVPGGSSGGPAAATSAGEALFSLGLGHGRQHPPACGFLRHCGTQADLRAGQPVRPGGLCIVPGPDWPHGQGRDRLRHGLERHRRPRPQGLDLSKRPQSSPDYAEGLTWRHPGTAAGCAPRIFRRRHG